MLPKEMKLFQFFPVSRTSENLSTEVEIPLHLTPDSTTCWVYSSSPHTAAGVRPSCCALQGKGQQTKENSSPQLHHLTAPAPPVNDYMM